MGGLSARCAHGGLAWLLCSIPSQLTATHALWPCMVTGQERGKLKLGDVGVWPPPQPPLWPLSGLIACSELDTVAHKCHRQTLKARNTPSPPHYRQSVTHLFAFYLYLGYQRLFDSQPNSWSPEVQAAESSLPLGMKQLLGRQWRRVKAYGWGPDLGGGRGSLLQARVGREGSLVLLPVGQPSFLLCGCWILVKLIFPRFLLQLQLLLLPAFQNWSSKTGLGSFSFQDVQMGKPAPECPVHQSAGPSPWLFIKGQQKTLESNSSPGFWKGYMGGAAAGGIQGGTGV